MMPNPLAKDQLIEQLRAELETATDRIDKLEWKNKGIAEWRDEYVRVKEQRDRLAAESESRKRQADHFSHENSALNTRLVNMESERDRLAAENAELRMALKCLLDTADAPYTSEDQAIAMAHKALKKGEGK